MSVESVRVWPPPPPPPPPRQTRTDFAEIWHPSILSLVDTGFDDLIVCVYFVYNFYTRLQNVSIMPWQCTLVRSPVRP